MVNRTNNALECYNKRFNCLFDKQPTLIEFVQIVEKETRFQAEKLQDIWAGKRVEVHRESVWVPEISLTYYSFKESLVTPAKTIKALSTKPAEKHGKKNKKRAEINIDEEIIHRSPMQEKNGRPNKRKIKKPKKSFP